MRGRERSGWSSSYEKRQAGGVWSETSRRHRASEQCRPARSTHPPHRSPLLMGGGRSPSRGGWVGRVLMQPRARVPPFFHTQTRTSQRSVAERARQAPPSPHIIHPLSSLPPSPPQVKLAAPFVAVPAALGMTIGSVTKKGVDGFYRTLNKPAWTPPNRAFPLAWSVLYVLMGAASYLATSAGAGAGAVKLYRLQLALNLAWSPLFFLAQDLSAALVGIVALDAAALATGRHFAAASETAGKLWAPYLAWLAFATLLTAKLWLDNPAARAGPWRGGRGGGGARRA